MNTPMASFNKKNWVTVKNGSNIFLFLKFYSIQSEYNKWQLWDYANMIFLKKIYYLNYSNNIGQAFDYNLKYINLYSINIKIHYFRYGWYVDRLAACIFEFIDYLASKFKKKFWLNLKYQNYTELYEWSQ